MIYETVVKLASKKKYSIRELEHLSGLKNGTIGKWKLVSPRVENLKKVADVLGVTVDQLLE